MAKRLTGLRITGVNEAMAMLTHVQKTLISPQIVQVMQTGMEIMATAARHKAPKKTGGLAGGIFTASQLSNRYKPISRQRGRRQQNIVQPLHNPPRKGQVLIVAGTFYGRWIERGRKPRARNDERGRRHERAAVGATRRRPFFKPGIRAAAHGAESYMAKRIERLIEDAAK